MVALRQTVQDFPPKDTIGSGFFVTEVKRGWYLPPYGERRRDKVLREFDRHEDNALWQGAEGGFLTKAANVPWEVTGEGYTVADRGRGAERLDAVSYFTDLLQQAHFGQGWKFQVKRSGRDYLSQDFGALWEIIGPGDPDTPLIGAVSGIAVLDSLRCFSTGNPEFPIIYFSQITGQLHRMHRTRIVRFVDMPDGDERMYGNGLCALSRYISIAQQQIYMSRYIVQNLDDKPKPGVSIWSNISDSNLQTAIAKYNKETTADELGPLGKTLNLFSIDPSAPATMNPVNFSTAPEKFDYKAFMEIHINALALVLGVDKQELWELGGGSLGSGAQSEMLAQKARGKAFGDFLSTIEQLINIRVLPDGDSPGATAQVKFAFKYKDEQEEEAQTKKDQALIQIAKGLKELGFGPQTIANMLADRSETFKELLTDDGGQVVTGTVADDSVEPERTAANDTPQLPEQPAAAQIPAIAGQKAYSATKAEFVAVLSDLIRGGLADDLSRRRFGIVMRGHLRRLGQMAYEDGLKAGGVEGEVDDDDLARVQDWLGEQSSYVTHFADTVYKEGLTPGDVQNRAELWAAKSLELMYQEGLKSADANGAYEWTLGATEDHCETCQRLAGQVHRLKEWYKRDLLPRRDKLACGGFNCKCSLKRVQKPAQGRF